MQVQCPSGFSFEIRKLKTKEANVLADAMAQKKGVVMDSILSSVYVRTIDNGPYNFKESPVWDEVLTGDRFYGWLMARIATHGPDYDFTVQCGSCPATIRWNLQLGDLPVKQLSPKAKEAFVNGNVFKDVGPGGELYTFHLNTGKHERRAQQILKQNPTEKITARLISSIDAIEGVADVRAHLENLDFGEALDLLDMLDSHDCGIDTDIEVVCQDCGATTVVALPFAQTGFWAPRSKRTKASS